MVLFDLLKTASIEDACEYLRGHGFDENMEKEDQIEVYKDFVSRLLKLSPIVSDDKYLLGYSSQDKYMNDNGTESIDICVYSRNTMIAGMTEINRIAASENAQEMSPDEISNFLDSVQFDTLNGYGFDFTPWEEVLGWKVDMENVKDCTIPAFIGVILFEMCFNGFLPEDQQERRDELDNSIKEFERIQKLPKEEQEKYFTPAEKIFKDMGLEDKRTEEEKKRDREIMNEDIYVNVLNKARMLQKFLHNTKDILPVIISNREELDEYLNSLEDPKDFFIIQDNNSKHPEPISFIQFEGRNFECSCNIFGFKIEEDRIFDYITSKLQEDSGGDEDDINSEYEYAKQCYKDGVLYEITGWQCEPFLQFPCAIHDNLDEPECIDWMLEKMDEIEEE